MNAEENLVLQGLKLEIANLALQIAGQRQAEVEAGQYRSLPEWVTLEQAAALKGGPSLTTYRQRQFLQPCCGRDYRIVGGRHCWHRDEVIRWLRITDVELKRYAAERSVKLPETYEKRGGE
ncbi:hypothetical protein AGMMS50268_09160 [Spirochaetia bacterium]|nr:hypothetical protein AGMMS50268_09160 [Spirochaetia bacterium]